MLLVLIALVELVAAIVGFAFRCEIMNSYEKALKHSKSAEDYRSNTGDKIKVCCIVVMSLIVEVEKVLIITPSCCQLEDPSPW